MPASKIDFEVYMKQATVISIHDLVLRKMLKP